MKKLFIFVLLSGSLFAQNVPTELEDIFSGSNTYPRTIPIGEDKVTLLDSRQYLKAIDSMVTWKANLEYCHRKLSEMDTLLSLKEYEDGLMIGTISEQQGSITLLSNTNRRVSDKSLEYYGTNTLSIGELKRKVSEDIQREKESKETWRKVAVRVGIVAILEALVIGLLIR